MLCRIDAASWQWEVKIDRCILAKLMREIEIFLLVTSSIRKAFFFRLKIQPKTTGTAIVFKKKKKKKKKEKKKTAIYNDDFRNNRVRLYKLFHLENTARTRVKFRHRWLCFKKYIAGWFYQPGHALYNAPARTETKGKYEI